MESTLGPHFSVKGIVLPALFDLPELLQWTHVWAKPTKLG
jgi:hypothetical protein